MMNYGYFISLDQSMVFFHPFNTHTNNCHCNHLLHTAWSKLIFNESRCTLWKRRFYDFDWNQDGQVWMSLLFRRNVIVRGINSVSLKHLLIARRVKGSVGDKNEKKNQKWMVFNSVSDTRIICDEWMFDMWNCVPVSCGEGHKLTNNWEPFNEDLCAQLCVFAFFVVAHNKTTISSNIKHFTCPFAGLLTKWNCDALRC